MVRSPPVKIFHRLGHSRRLAKALKEGLEVGVIANSPIALQRAVLLLCPAVRLPILLGSGIFCICVFSGETGIFRLLTALS